MLLFILMHNTVSNVHVPYLTKPLSSYNSLCRPR